MDNVYDVNVTGFVNIELSPKNEASSVRSSQCCLMKHIDCICRARYHARNMYRLRRFLRTINSVTINYEIEPYREFYNVP